MHYMCTTVIAEKFGFPGNKFALIGFFGFVLMRAEWFLKKAKALGFWSCLGIALLNIACALLLQTDFLNNLV